MATSSTLKTLKQQDGPIDQSDSPKRVRSNDLAGRLQTLGRSIWRRRWLSVGTAWAICLAGWAMIALWPTEFIASAVVHADLDELVDPNTADGQPNQTPIALLKSMLTSEAALADVRDDLPLDLAASERLQSDIMLRSTVPPVFVLAYGHHNPEVAKQVVEAVVAAFQSRLEAAPTITSQEVEVLDVDIDRHEQRLRAVEADLVAFREGNKDYFDGVEGRAAELALMEEETTSLEREIRTLTAERDGIATELAIARVPDAEIDPPRSLEDIAAERQALESELAKLRERYADSHPYVIAVVEAIEGLDAEERALASSADDVGAAELSPRDRAALERRHQGLIAEVSTLTLLLDDKREEFELLQTLTRTAGSVEAEFAELEAQRDALRSALSDLRRNRDELAERDGGQAEQEPFRLIKPPEVPTDPVGPSRLAALAAVLLGGAGLGASVAVICNRFKGVFESAWQLRQRFDVGVLGTISEVMSPAERKQLDRSRLAFGLACLALVGVFGGLTIAEATDQLAPLGEHLRARLSG